LEVKGASVAHTKGSLKGGKGFWFEFIFGGGGGGGV